MADPGELLFRRVLVVDDDPATLDVVRRMLELRGIQVDTASSGPEALERLRQDPLPHVILLDVMMPHMSGHEVLRSIRADERTAELPVIFLTAKSQDEDVLEAYSEGADYYITKPFTSSQVLYGIGLVLGDPDVEEGEPEPS